MGPLCGPCLLSKRHREGLDIVGVSTGPWTYLHREGMTSTMSRPCVVTSAASATPSLAQHRLVPRVAARVGWNPMKDHGRRRHLSV